MAEGAVDLTLSDDDAGRSAGAAVKPEADEAGFEGAYDCLMCFTSCRQQPALHCTACTCNPWHVSCAAGTQFERVCPQCGRESVAQWKRGRFTTLQHSEECVDLVAEEEAAEERQREREREESRKRELDEREEARKREFQRAREQQKERHAHTHTSIYRKIAARATEDATRREQEWAREEEERKRQREDEREEEWRKFCQDTDEDQGRGRFYGKYEDDFMAALRQSAAGNQHALLLLQRKTQEQQQEQQQPHLPALAGAKGKAMAECMDMGPGTGGGASAPAAPVVWDHEDYEHSRRVQAQRQAQRLLNAVGAESFGEFEARARGPTAPLPFSALLPPSSGPDRSAGAASPIKTDPGRRQGDIARIKKRSRDKLHKTVMR
jgi:hypothetical protein